MKERTPTIVRSAEDRNQRAVIPELVTIFHNHVRPTDEVHIVSSEKVVDDAFPETIADTSLVVLPICCVIRGVGP